MTTKQILLTAFMLGTINNIALPAANKTATKQKPTVRRFDKGLGTVLNDTGYSLFMSVMIDSNNCTKNDDVKIMKITNGKIVQQGTVRSFRNAYNLDTPDRNEKMAIVQDFWDTAGQNGALFDSNNQTITYGNKTEITNYYNKVQSSNKKRVQQIEDIEAKLRFNKKFVERSCREGQCIALKTEIEQTEKELNKLYQNL